MRIIDESWSPAVDRSVSFALGSSAAVGSRSGCSTTIEARSPTRAPPRRIRRRSTSWPRTASPTTWRASAWWRRSFSSGTGRARSSSRNSTTRFSRTTRAIPLSCSANSSSPQSSFSNVCANVQASKSYSTTRCSTWRRRLTRSASRFAGRPASPRTPEPFSSAPMAAAAPCAAARASHSKASPGPSASSF